MAGTEPLERDWSGPAVPTRRRLRTALMWIAALAGVTGATFYALVAFGVLDPAALIAALARFDAQLAILVIPFSLANYLLRGIRWHLLSRILDQRISLLQSLGYYFTGYSLLLSPGKLGEVVRLWLLKVRHGVTFSRSVGLIVVDRLVDLVCLLLLAGIGLLVDAKHMGVLAGAVPALLAIAALLSSRRLVVGGTSALHRLTGRRWPSVFLMVLTADRSLRGLFEPRTIAICVLLSLVAWIAQTVCVWLVIGAAGYTGSILDAAIIYAVALLAGGAALVPGGADAALIGLLVLSGMSAETALVAALMARLATWWLAMLIGLIVAPFVLAARNRPSTLAPN